MKDSRGIIYSSTLHGFILLFLLFGLPDFFHRTLDAEPESISVEILPIAPISNVKPQEAAPESQEKKPQQEKTVEKKATQETRKEEPKPEEKPEPIPDQKAPKVEKKKPEKKKPEPKKDDLASVLKSIQDQAKAEEGKKPAQVKADPAAKPAKSQHYDPGAPLSMSQKDAIRQQIEVHWNPPIGAKEAENLKVTLHIEMGQDGTVTKVDFENKTRYYSDSFYRAAVDSAVRAVQQASPLKNLPPEKYNVMDGWSTIDMNFDPHDLL